MMTIQDAYASISKCERKVRTLLTEHPKNWYEINKWLDRIEELENIIRELEAKSA